MLPSIRPAVVRTTLQSFWHFNSVARVSLLHLAAYWGWKNIAICLVAVHQCVAKWRDDRGHTPLHYAAYNGHMEVVKYFITELLCDPMDRTEYGWTAFHITCINGHLNIIQYLTSELYRNPSCEDNIGDTPLHFASRNGHLNIIQYLISEGHCDPSCVNMPTLFNISYQLDVSIHWLRTRMATLHCPALQASIILSNYCNHS